MTCHAVRVKFTKQAVTRCLHLALRSAHRRLQVLPRSEADLDNAFIVMHGSVQVVFGHLGRYVLSTARRQPQQAGMVCSGSRGSASQANTGAAHGHTASPLMHQQTKHSSDEQAVWDAREAEHRARAHAYLSPHAVAQAMDAALSALRRPSWQLEAQALPHALPPEACAELLRLRADPDVVRQTATLSAGQMFAGPNLAAWSDSKTAWPAPVQAQVAVAANGPFAAVLVVPKAAMLAAVKLMEEHVITRIVNACCRLPALQHLTTGQLARLAQFCTEKELPARHELLRQLHHCTHVYLLTSGSVELSAFTYVPEKATLQPDTLAPSANHRIDQTGAEQSSSVNQPAAKSSENCWAKLRPKRPTEGLLKAVEHTGGFMRFFMDGDGHKVRTQAASECLLVHHVWKSVAWGEGHRLPLFAAHCECYL